MGHATHWERRPSRSRIIVGSSYRPKGLAFPSDLGYRDSNVYYYRTRYAAPHTHRIRQHGKDRSPIQRLLGGADAAIAAAFQYWARHHAAGIDSRFRHS